MAVLSRLGGGHLHDLTRAPLQYHEAVLTQRRALHGIGGRGAGVARREVQLVGHGGGCGARRVRRVARALGHLGL